ncbi:MAG: 16S rRNA (cytidine(1402)-2'-O)-methyltransferase [Syntrophomonadaceae bacterium]|nr:16S rRNA (cytidine(1402)-2'-O)-methyltransferase [Syntrophomonadaceae bacterium]
MPGLTEREVPTGVLYLCATPIGNLEDVSVRLLKTLRHVHLIACEDTRQTAKLLRRYRIRTPMLSYHQHNRRQREGELLETLREGHDVALLSDAGTPGISDPGSDLVRRAVEEGVAVTAIPGPSALVCALAISGMDTSRFTFEGFLPPRAARRRAFLQELRGEVRTMVFYEAPHRVLETLADMEEVLGDRRVTVARELTKRFEEVFRGALSQAREHFSQHPPRGEFTLVLEGSRGEAARVSAEQVRAEVEALLAQGVEKKEALRMKALQYGIPRRDIYRWLARRED